MATVNTMDTVDVLCDLLAGEQGSIFHFLREADPYIKPEQVELRRSLQQIIDADRRRKAELIRLISEQGGGPRPCPVCSEHQYMAYLSVGYLLPKLLQARQATLGRYEQAIAAVSDEETKSLLKTHLIELHEEMESLRKAALA